MDIKKLSYSEYMNLFEIDNVKRALFLSIKSHNTLSKFKLLDISKLRRISKLQKDFKACCYKIIKKELSSVDEYINCAKTLILIVSEIRTIIRKNKIKDCYGQVYSYLPLSETTFEAICNGNITNIVIYGSYITIFFTFFNLLIFAITAQTIESLIFLLITVFILIAFSMFNLIFNKRLSNCFSIDKIKRIKDRNIYLKSLRSQKSFGFISKFINIIRK